MIEISKETTILTSAVPGLPMVRRVPRLHPSTIQRWIHRGVLGPAGSRVKLEALRLGGRWYTSVEALQRFSSQLSSQSNLGGNNEANPANKSEPANKALTANAALDRLGY